MRYLIDTHVIIWALEKSDELSSKVSRAIEDPDNEIFFSFVSLWEIAIKRSIGKLRLRYSIPSVVEELGKQSVDALSLDALAVEEVENLPFLEKIKHADPFDRALIAQAKANDLVIITKDKMFKHYDVKLLW